MVIRNTIGIQDNPMKINILSLGQEYILVTKLLTTFQDTIISLEDVYEYDTTIKQTHNQKEKVQTTIRKSYARRNQPEQIQEEIQTEQLITTST